MEAKAIEQSFTFWRTQFPLPDHGTTKRDPSVSTYIFFQITDICKKLKKYYTCVVARQSFKYV
jgi:hypothetical protein